MSKKCPNAEVSKLRKISIANMPTVQASAISFAGQGTEYVFVADMLGNVYELSLIVDGIKATSQVVKSFSSGVGDLFWHRIQIPCGQETVCDIVCRKWWSLCG